MIRGVRTRYDIFPLFAFNRLFHRVNILIDWLSGILSILLAQFYNRAAYDDPVRQLGDLARLVGGIDAKAHSR